MHPQQFDSIEAQAIEICTHILCIIKYIPIRYIFYIHSIYFSLCNKSVICVSVSFHPVIQHHVTS